MLLEFVDVILAMDVEFEAEVEFKTKAGVELELLLLAPDRTVEEELPPLVPAYRARPITIITTITIAAPAVVEIAVFRSLNFMLFLLRKLSIACTEPHPEDSFVADLEEKL
jgi:hypothetical protein